MGEGRGGEEGGGEEGPAEARGGCRGGTGLMMMLRLMVADAVLRLTMRAGSILVRW